MADRPAFYARRGGPAADWWTLLHPPYTLWHLSYVALGAAAAPGRDWLALGATLLAFFLAVGVAAHALDELAGRPLGTGVPAPVLATVAALALAGAVALGLVGVFGRGPVDVALLVAIPLGVLLVVGYNLELAGGRLHTDLVFALAWGGFPVLVGYLAQRPPRTGWGLAAAAVATLAGVTSAAAQRRLSSPARRLRRRTVVVSGIAGQPDGSVVPLDKWVLLDPLEGSLRALAWTMPLLAATALLAGR